MPRRRSKSRWLPWLGDNFRLIKPSPSPHRDRSRENWLALAFILFLPPLWLVCFFTPTKYLWYAIPALVLTFLLAAAFLLHWLSRARRFDSRICRHCGYDRSGTTATGPCPECGRSLLP